MAAHILKIYISIFFSWFYILTGKISEPLIESETTLNKGDQDNCDANTFLETVQVHSENAESEGNSFLQNIFSVKTWSKVLWS